ncbi:MAG: hypothetical protein ACOCSM_02445, partial [Bacillota bacterium]
RFMRAFAQDALLKKSTKEAMIKNPRFLYPGIGYGMGVWVLEAPFYDLSKMRQAYGVFGATGSFLIYHPKTRSVISGSFNHEAYQITSVRFVMKVIKILLEV